MAAPSWQYHEDFAYHRVRTVRTYVLTYVRTYVGYLLRGERCGPKKGVVVTLVSPEYLVATSANVTQVAFHLPHYCFHFVSKVDLLEGSVQMGVVDLHDPCGVPVMVEYQVSSIPAAVFDVGAPVSPVRV